MGFEYSSADGLSSLQVNISLRSLMPGVEPFEQSPDSELVKVAEQLTGYSASSVAYATEGPFLQQMGMDTIVMGPGSIDQAHQPDGSKVSVQKLA